MRILICLIFISFSIVANAQSNKTLTGKINNDKGEPLVASTVIALTPSDSIMVGFSITDNDGIFKIGNLKSGTYILQITYVGYGTF